MGGLHAGMSVGVGAALSLLVSDKSSGARVSASTVAA